MNLEILKYIQSFHNPFWDWFFVHITMFGEETFYILVLTIVYWCINKEFGYKLGFISLSSYCLNGTIKTALKVQRPIGSEGIRSLRVETATGYSFPSGHTQGAATFWTTLMVGVNKRTVNFAGFTFVLLIGFSRLYLGVHWPTDVFGGIIFGVLWVLIGSKTFDYAHANRRGEILLAIGIPFMIGLLFFKDKDYYSSVGTLLGFLAGYIIETKYIRFNVKALIGNQIAKVVLGLLGVAILKFVVKLILPQELIYDLFRYILIGIWVTIGAPYLFIKLKLASN